MGFLKNLFGGGEPKPYVDKNGIYFYTVTGSCHHGGVYLAQRIGKLSMEADFG